MTTPKKSDPRKVLCTNPNARRNYFIEEVIEAGLVLKGTEIKSLRTEAAHLKEAFVEVRAAPQGKGRLEAWLCQAHIGPYKHGNIWNHEPLRKRKLLLHHRELEKIFGASQKKGMTIIPMDIHLTKGRAKIDIGLGKGKKSHDKRQDLKEKDAHREMDRAMKGGKGGRRG